MRPVTFLRGIGALLLATFYAAIALVFGGRSVAQCLGPNNSACVAAWYASMSPLDRAIHDAPWWALPIAIFAALWAVTLAIALVSRRIPSRDIQ
jgi:hypothetical protein